MVLNISLPEFKKIFDNEKLYLPIRWDGNDFICTLDKLYHLYQSQINETIKNDEMENVHKQINAVCSLLINSILSSIFYFDFKNECCVLYSTRHVIFKD